MKAQPKTKATDTNEAPAENAIPTSRKATPGYKVLIATNQVSLVELVNKHLAAGWALQGGIAVTQEQYQDPKLHQAVYHPNVQAEPLPAKAQPLTPAQLIPQSHLQHLQATPAVVELPIDGNKPVGTAGFQVPGQKPGNSLPGVNIIQ